MKGLSGIKEIYRRKKKHIKARLREFGRVWRDKRGKDAFSELAFCILTPQSKARACWGSISNLSRKGLLRSGDEGRIRGELNCVRFKNKKAKYLCGARKLFIVNGRVAIIRKLKEFSTPFEARDWLVHNVKGLGYKEASHFLRNIGLGKGLAILDRHILRNLERFKVIGDVPGAISRKKYFEIEKKMVKFADRLNIPMTELDMVFWYNETGDIFK